jgi:hypothetical protein
MTWRERFKRRLKDILRPPQLPPPPANRMLPLRVAEGARA